MSGSFYCFGEFALMLGANARSFSRPDFSQAGNKPFQKVSIFEINFFDVALTKITRHILKRYLRDIYFFFVNNRDFLFSFSGSGFPFFGSRCLTRKSPSSRPQLQSLSNNFCSVSFIARCILPASRLNPALNESQGTLG